MSAKRREIPVESIEVWEAHNWGVQQYGEELEGLPDRERRLDDHIAILQGEADLRLPDGSVWGRPVWDYDGAPRFAGETEEVLLDYVLDHLGHDGHPLQKGYPAILFNRATLDPTQTYCLDCRAWIDLSVMARQIDEQGNRVPDDDETA